MKRPIGIWLITLYGVFLALLSGASIVDIFLLQNDSKVKYVFDLDLSLGIFIFPVANLIASILFAYTAWMMRKRALVFLALLAFLPALIYAPMLISASEFYDLLSVSPTALLRWVLINMACLIYLTTLLKQNRLT